MIFPGVPVVITFVVRIVIGVFMPALLVTPAEKEGQLITINLPVSLLCLFIHKKAKTTIQTKTQNNFCIEKCAEEALEIC